MSLISRSTDNADDKPYLASMLFSCPDQVGVIAELADFFSTRKLSISRYAEYTDAGLFFSRLEWSLGSRWETEADFIKEFNPLASRYEANFDVRFMHRRQSVGLFVSSQPHALIEMLNKFEANYFPTMEISFIIGNHEPMQRIADRHGVPFFFIDTDEVDTSDYERQQLNIVQRYKPDCIGLARYMKVLSADFIDQVACPIVNIHHSFLPSFVGAKPYQMAYERGVKLIGATSHFVTPELDQGPIIEQGVQRVKAGDSVQEMIKMGRDIEQRVFVQAMLKVLEHKVMVYQNRTIVFD